ncbi:MAG: TetR/AcrR family transcriptional regulator [Solirubrobacteraceae bacterium]
MPRASSKGQPSAEEGYRDAVRQLLRHRLLDAARGLLQDRSWGQVTMAEAASAAGVSRQTLYNEFGTRDELGQALVIRESGRFLDAVEDAIDAHPDDPLEAIREALERFLTIAATDPFVRLLLADDGTSGLLPLVTTQSLPVLDWAGERLATAITARWPMANKAEVRAGTDAIVRLAISHAIAPRDTPARASATITQLLAPSIKMMLQASTWPGAGVDDRST